MFRSCILKASVLNPIVFDKYKLIKVNHKKKQLEILTGSILS